MAFGTTVQHRTPQLFAGRLRHQIQIVQPKTTQDSMGGSDISKNVVLATVWASVEALNGTEKFAAHEFVTQVSHQIVIRKPDSLTLNAGMQVWFQTRQFQIECVLNPDERNKMLILLCIEINDSNQQNPSS